MSAEATPHPLALGFAPASLDQWRTLVDKALKGADFDKRLVAATADGLRIKPLYTRADARKEAPMPGVAPFTRGTHATASGFGWTILSLIEAGDAAAANRAILAELEGGAGGIVLAVEAPGQTGAAVASPSDLNALLAGVNLDFARLEIDAGVAGAAVARALIEALAVLEGTRGQRHIAVNLDPLGALARLGSAGAPIDAALTDAIKVAADVRAAEPSARTILVDATLYHEAGASDGQEIALLAATLVAYLRAFDASGVSPAEALAQINIRLAADADVFSTAAKLRAARSVIARIADACGSLAATAHVHITTVTSARMMARRDPWTNMLRTTAATAASAIGGTDALLVLPYTHALGLSDAFARRIARNTQIVAQEESHLGTVLDPAGGSWYVEQLTAELAAKGWELFQRIEAEGGLAAALKSSFVQQAISAVAADRARAIGTGRVELTGVSAFPLLGPDGVTVTKRPAAPPLGGTPEIEPLKPIRLAEAFEALRDAADQAPKRPEVFLAALGEIADHTARSSWLKNMLASGGIGSLANDGYPSPEAAAAAFKASGAQVAVIASSDAVYAAHAAACARALKAAGATHVAVAGRPGELEADLKAAGVDRFIYAGQDRLATLGELQRAILASA